MATFDNPLRNSQKRGRHWARRSHRIVAISALAFLLLLTVTGLVLNHADTFGLPQNQAPSGFVQWAYGIEPAPVDAVFETSGIVLASIAGSLYANGREIASEAGTIRGAVTSQDFVVAATNREWLLITRNGSLIERSPLESSQAIRRIGNAGARVIVDAGSGFAELDLDQLTLSRLSISTDAIDWSKPAALDNVQQLELSSAASSASLSWERVLLDLHSGRILPKVGRYLADLTALCLLYLCISGLLLWFRRR
ncbi:MAG: PepSY domain-containing protein [Gammaproteobacteria bacterium]|nr:PepSY domain-containing protein [Gammaproteobacteria bacterium]